SPRPQPGAGQSPSSAACPALLTRPGQMAGQRNLGVRAYVVQRPCQDGDGDGPSPGAALRRFPEVVSLPGGEHADDQPDDQQRRAQALPGPTNRHQLLPAGRPPSGPPAGRPRRPSTPYRPSHDTADQSSRIARRGPSRLDVPQALPWTTEPTGNRLSSGRTS